MSKFRWRPILAVTMAYIAGIFRLAASELLPSVHWIILTVIGAVVLVALYQLAED